MNWQYAASVLSEAGEVLNAAAKLLFSPSMGVLAALLGTLIVIHQRYYKRPELILEATPGNWDPIVGPDGTSISAELSLINAGHAAAEDVYVSFTLPDWRFDEDEIKEVQETTLRVNEERTYGFIGVVSERHDLFIENIIYQQDTFSLYYDHPRFDSDGCYKVEYVVACKGHGPRNGALYFCVDGQNLTVHREFPTRWRSFRSWLGWEPPVEPRTVSVQ